VNPDDLGYFAAVRTAPPPPPPPPPWTPPARPEGESGLGIGEGLAVTGLALLASLFLTLGHRTPGSGSYDKLLREGLVTTLFFYLALGTLVGGYVVVRKVRLVWHRGSAAGALAVGAPVGLAGGALGVAVNSGLHGHLSGDPGIELLVGGGGVLRVVLALVVTSVLAPLVEETVFRGICGGSFLAKGSAAALWTSAIGFAIWHMRPESLRYYAAMGLLLGGLWHKRGLLASMSAHACFNGVLTAVAVLATSGHGSYRAFEGVHFEVPGGWHEVQQLGGVDAFSGPAGASLAVSRRALPVVPTADELLARVTEGQPLGPSGIQVVPGTAHVVLVDAVEGVSVDLTANDQPGHLLLLPAGTRLYSFVIVTGGSPSAEQGWRRLGRSIVLDPQGG
jgi:membrane protease YdiL (CAAX protease family)